MSKRRKFTDYEKKTVYEKYKGHCAICGKPISKRKMVISHEIPLSKGGTNAFNNIQLACWSCAQVKQNFTEEEFIQKLWEIFDHKHVELIEYHVRRGGKLFDKKGNEYNLFDEEGPVC